MFQPQLLFHFALFCWSFKITWSAFCLVEFYGVFLKLIFKFWFWLLRALNMRSTLNKNVSIQYIVLLIIGTILYGRLKERLLLTPRSWMRELSLREWGNLSRLIELGSEGNETSIYATWSLELIFFCHHTSVPPLPSKSGNPAELGKVSLFWNLLVWPFPPFPSQTLATHMPPLLAYVGSLEPPFPPSPHKTNRNWLIWFQV